MTPDRSNIGSADNHHHLNSGQHSVAHSTPQDESESRGRIVGMKRSHFFGGLFLIALLLGYVIMLVRPTNTVPSRRPPQVPIESNTDHPHPKKP